MLLTHHHLSEPSYGEDVSFDAERVLMEGWNSEIIVTTFVQLFQTMISYEKDSSRRFHKLQNAVVIIDEIQALPYKYWLAVGSVMQYLADNFNTRFVIMTATQPVIPCQATELVEDKEKYFKSFNRYNVYLHPQNHTVESFIDSLELDETKTYLFIANTIYSSKEMFNLLKKRYQDKPIGYLSTAITPYERRERINDIKDGKYRIVVSTQLVEAGVDIDFDVVYRDFAPLDSLIQSAGRCNRNGKKDRGDFHVVSLISDKGRTFSSMIYSPILLQETRKVLANADSITEAELISLVNQYFRGVESVASPDESKRILDGLAKLEYSSSDFKLIEEQVYKSSVFIALNDEARDVLRQYEEIVNQLRRKQINTFEAKSRFNRIKSKFFDFVISVNIKGVKGLEHIGSIYVGKDIQDVYDPETGFKGLPDYLIY